MDPRNYSIVHLVHWWGHCFCVGTTSRLQEVIGLKVVFAFWMSSKLLNFSNMLRWIWTYLAIIYVTTSKRYLATTSNNYIFAYHEDSMLFSPILKLAWQYLRVSTNTICIACSGLWASMIAHKPRQVWGFASDQQLRFGRGNSGFSCIILDFPLKQLGKNGPVKHDLMDDGCVSKRYILPNRLHHITILHTSSFLVPCRSSTYWNVTGGHASRFWKSQQDHRTEMCRIV